MKKDTYNWSRLIFHFWSAARTDLFVDASAFTQPLSSLRPGQTHHADEDTLAPASHSNGQNVNKWFGFIMISAQRGTKMHNREKWIEMQVSSLPLVVELTP
jgi:hypothetical protein